MKLVKSYRFWIGVFILLGIIILRFSGIADFITLEYLQSKRIGLQNFVAAHYIFSVMSYIAIYAIEVILALPFSALLTMLGGLLFGVIPAVIYTNIGATIGATIFFLIVRYSLGTLLQSHFSKQLHWFNEQMRKYGTSYLVAVHFIAIIPFFIVNILIGLSKVPVWQFIWTTSVGIIPSSLVFAYTGKQLATISSASDIISWNMIFAFVLLAILALIPVIVQRYHLERK